MTSIALNGLNISIFSPVQRAFIGLISLSLALAIHWLAFTDLQTMPCVTSDTCLVYPEPICDCGITIEMPTPPDNFVQGYGLMPVCDCAPPPPRLLPIKARPTDIDYIHFPNSVEAAVARGHIEIRERTFVTVTCTATPDGKLQNCTAVSPSPLAEATVQLFESTARVKPIGDVIATSSYEVRLTYMWERT